MAVIALNAVQCKLRNFLFIIGYFFRVPGYNTYRHMAFYTGFRFFNFILDPSSRIEGIARVIDIQDPFRKDYALNFPTGCKSHCGNLHMSQVQ